MKRIIISSLLFLLFVSASFSQTKKINIGILTRNVDTTFTHLYVDVARSMNKLHPHPFNVIGFYIDNLKNYFPDSSYDIKPIAWQSEYNKFNFYNLNRKPSKKCRQWIEKLNKENDIDYIIFFDGSKSFYIRVLSNSYGAATYYNNYKLFSIYYMVSHSIYSTNPIQKFKINYPKRFYLENHIRLSKEESLKKMEVENISDIYYKMAVDSIEHYAGKQIDLISKKILEKINK